MMIALESNNELDVSVKLGDDHYMFYDIFMLKA